MFNFKFTKQSKPLKPSISISIPNVKDFTPINNKINLQLYNEPIIKDMAVLLCYFNPCKYTRIIQNAFTVKHLFDIAKIPYFITEIKHDSDDKYLFYPSDNVFQYSSNSYLFYKENLITTMEKRIPDIYTKLCTIDFDIVFDNPDWYSIISEKLNHVSVTQPFKNAYYLNLDYSVNNVKKNCIDNRESIHINYTLEHSGFIWAFNRTWFNDYTMNDYLIAGSGDTILANNITKKIGNDAASKLYYSLLNFKKYTTDVTYDSCHLNIYHLNHGLIINRQYTSLNIILYDIISKLKITYIDEILVRRADNILEYNPNYLTLFNSIMINYFKKRNDDGC